MSLYFVQDVVWKVTYFKFLVELTAVAVKQS